MRRRHTAPGWDGRGSSLFGDRRGSGVGAGWLWAALLTSHHSSGSGGWEGDSSVVQPGLTSLLSLLCLPVYLVLSDAHRVGVRDGGVVRAGGQGGGGGLDHHLSQGWGRVGPSERENINIVLFVNHWTALTRDM